LADSHESLLSELSNALLRSIAQDSQVELIVEPPIKPPLTAIDAQSEQIAINLMTMPNDIRSKPIATTTITRILQLA
jgi:hypothetical protein